MAICGCGMVAIVYKELFQTNGEQVCDCGNNKFTIEYYKNSKKPTKKQNWTAEIIVCCSKCNNKYYIGY